MKYLRIKTRLFRRAALSLLTLVLAFTTQTARADYGWYDGSMSIGDINTDPTAWSTDPDNPTDLGNVTNMTITSIAFSVWSDANDRGGANMYFRIWDGGESQVGTDQDLWLGASTRIEGDHDFSISWSGSEDLADAVGLTLEAGKTYYITMWAKTYGDSGDEWYSGGGANYHAKLTYGTSILTATVTGVESSYDWTGSVIHPVPVVTLNNNVLSSETDYDVTYSEGCTDVGNYDVTITGKGNYAGTKVVPFTINNVYFLVGSMTDWQRNQSYKLVANPEAEDEYYINGVELSANDAFKVQSAEDVWFPYGYDNDYVISAGGTYNIYFRPNYDGGYDWYCNCIYAADVTPIKVTLTDGEAITGLDTYKGQEIWVNYTRSFTAGKPSTVCLPFAYTKKTGDGSFYEFTGIEKVGSEYIATMTEPGTSTLTANTPYLYKAATTGNADFSGTHAIPASLTAGSTTSNGWTFKGTYSTIEWTSAPAEPTYGFSAQDANAGITQGQFIKVGSYVRIKPMRAYLEYNGSDSQFINARSLTRAAATTSDDTLPETIGVRLISANGEVTAIGTLHTRTGEVSFDSEAWYTLDGKRLNAKPNTKGIYVNNGKKVVIK